MNRRASRSAITCVLLLAVTTNVKADERSDQLVRQVIAKIATLRSMTGTLAMTGLRDGKTVTASGPFRLMKPNKALVQTKGEMASTLSSDGKEMIVLVASGYYKKEAVDAKGNGLYFSWALQVPAFFTPSEVLAIFKGWKSTYGGKHKLSAGECDKVVFTDPKDSNYHTTFYISPDKVPVRFEMESTTQGLRMTAEMSNIKLKPPLAAADFAYKLPATAKLYEPPK
jgi:outer membrane lipoprotein-sorting protein